MALEYEKTIFHLSFSLVSIMCFFFVSALENSDEMEWGYPTVHVSGVRKL